MSESKVFGVVMDDGGHLHLIASKRTKDEAYELVSYMEAFDDELGLPAVTYRVVPWPQQFINAECNFIEKYND